jgi:gliding motility-associated-like protein
MKLRVLILILGLSQAVPAQNLVRNWDFSALVDSSHQIWIGTASSGINNFVGWRRHATPTGQLSYNRGGAHLYARPWDGAFNWNIPGNRDHPLPYVGSGYISLGITLGESYFLNSGFGVSLHLSELLDSLQKDSTYCVELRYRAWNGWYVPNQNYTSGYRACWTHKDLGVFFHTHDTIPIPLGSNQPPPDFSMYAGVVNDKGYITNTEHWEEMRGSFKAKGQERFLFITNVGFGVSPSIQYSFQNDCPNNFQMGFVLVDALMVFNCNDTLLTVDLGPDTLVCPNDSLLLHARWSGFKLEDTVVTYTWYHNDVLLPDTDSVLLATQAGTYRVVVTINHRFRAEARVKVDFYPEEPDTALIPPEITLCLDQQELLFLPDIPYTTYQWTSGETTRRYRIFQPGHFGVTATSPCWQRTDATEVIYENCNSIWIPNAFTPDGDGINDVFEIRGAKFPVKLWIFDRWGNVVYQSEDYQNDWTGIYPNGQPAPGGVYTYKVSWRRSANGSERDLFGTITILR